MDYDRFDVVIVPFPFTDKAQAKRRPALVVSANAAFNKKTGHSVMARQSGFKSKNIEKCFSASY